MHAFCTATDMLAQIGDCESEDNSIFPDTFRVAGQSI